MLPQSNATLTAVGQKERTEAFRDAEETAPDVLWAGEAAAYLQVKRERVSAQGAESLLVRRTLIVEEGEPAVAFDSEQTITFEFGGDPITAEIQNVERRVLDGMGEVQTTRLVLTDE